MANPVLFSNAYVAISTTTAAAYAVLSGNKGVEAPMSRAELDNAAMGDDVEAKYPGILSVPITLTHRQDFTTAAGGIDKTIWPLFNSRTKIRVKVRPVNSAVASSNPSYIWPGAYITGITPITGSHGELLGNKIDIRIASGHTFTRSTTT